MLQGGFRLSALQLLFSSPFFYPCTPAQGYVCRRPPLSTCTEAEFLDDLVAFLSRLRGRPIDRSRFPEAVLNGGALDLFALYREVVTRGGFRVGNGINWKGQVGGGWRDGG